MKVFPGSLNFTKDFNSSITLIIKHFGMFYKINVLNYYDEVKDIGY